MSVPGVVSPAADRFYCPPPRRHLLDKQHRQHPPLTASAAEEPAKPTPEELRRDPFPSPATATTNLESFIISTAVRLPARCPPQTSGTRACRAGAPYYELADLWEAFGEWSAYGAGVPLLLNGTDGVVQYYVPFLSAIQLYGSRPPPSSKRQETMMSKEHVIFLSVFLLFKFLSKDLIMPSFIACFIHGIDALFVTISPSIKRFLTEECKYKVAVSRTSLIHVSVDFVKSRVLASIPGFFFYMCYAAKKHCLAKNVLGISSCIQRIKMLSMGPLNTTILVFPIADAAWRFSLLTTGDTVIPGIFVALALPIAIPGCRKNRFFNCACLRYGVGSTVITIIMNWFQATPRGQPPVVYVASGVIGFVAVHCLWNRKVKQDDINHLMGKVWDWNMYGAKLKKFGGWVLHTANEDGEGGEDDATSLLKDCGDGAEDGGSGPEHGNIGLENHDSGLDDSGMASKDSNDESCQREPRQHEWLGKRAVQLLAIRANFPICEIYGFDWQQGRFIYKQRDGEVQEEGMVDLVPIGPRDVLMAYGYFSLEVYDDNDKESDPIITEDWDVEVDDEIKEYTHNICAGPGREFEITYLVIPYAIGAEVEVKLNLKGLAGSRSRDVYGKIKASTTDYRNRSVHLFSCGRGTTLSFPSGSTSILPLSPSVVAVPCRRQLELDVEVDLTVITTCDSQEEQDKNLKFSLEFTHEITSQRREIDDDQVEVNIMWFGIV